MLFSSGTLNVFLSMIHVVKASGNVRQIRVGECLLCLNALRRVHLQAKHARKISFRQVTVLSIMDDDLAQIRASLARLEESVNRIEQTLSETQKSCSNMDAHITFVESVYASVRSPLSFIASRFTGSRPLPLHNSDRRSYDEATSNRYIRDEAKVLKLRRDLEHERRKDGEHNKGEQCDSP